MSIVEDVPYSLFREVSFSWKSEIPKKPVQKNFENPINKTSLDQYEIFWFKSREKPTWCSSKMLVRVESLKSLKEGMMLSSASILSNHFFNGVIFSSRICICWNKNTAKWDRVKKTHIKVICISHERDWTAKWHLFPVFLETWILALEP